MLFDQVASQQQLRASTRERYRSWIRRYVKSSKKRGLALSIEGTLEFLRGYQSQATRRQGYYALKFLFTKVISLGPFFTLTELRTSGQRRAAKWKRWWRL